ncbi:MAG: DUF1080 domain-containing protein [Verrucomicrobia bacterium]|nr:MAG: DUF1080 domain-containing protein [Verrucomicrobiota bacterium]
MNPRSFLAAFCGVSLLAVGCATNAPSSVHNALSASQTRAGWRLLFDGTTAGWRGFNKAGFPAQGWVVEDGWLHHVAKAGGGDIVTKDRFGDFELEFEWRIGKGANSGVKYFVDEQRGAPIGHEYQVIDDALHPDALHGPKRQTAALYDAIAPDHPPIRPAGETNQSRILVRGNHVEHWLNGRRVVSYEIGGDALATAKAASKFKAEARWGTKFPTPILLQDHGDDVWYRDVRIRVLPAS